MNADLPTPVAPLFTAVILAGSRPGGDPMAQAAGVASKALLRVGGQAMLARVARTLLSHPGTARLVVLAQQTDALAADADCAWMREDPRTAFVTSGAGISHSILNLLERGEAAFPVLLTTADNVLLDHAMIDSFLGGLAGADLAVAMVERRVLLARYPESRRTWLKFRGGWWSGANLFWLAGDKVMPLLAFWHGVEQDRKKGMKIVGAFGPLLLLGALFRMLTIHQAVARAGRRFGLAARVVPMPQAEACIDVDKAGDWELAEAILARRN
jgi:GTP:adenosylcobinamide-phosphate guanylyltransferase